jgi:DNA-binding SARP family transcriptional activator/tetratricopeptide (TPR) repeat protein
MRQDKRDAARGAGWETRLVRAATHPGELYEAGGSTPALSVRLFGELDLRLGDERLAPLESARARSLLGYLLLHDDAPHSRQRLAFLLWPDSTEAQARTNLRNVIHTLRWKSPEIERFLEVTPRTLQWRREAPCRVDVAEFASAVAGADAAEAGSDRMVAALRTAVDLYVGDLLEGCYDEWLIDERERFRDRYISALRRLTGALADRGEHSEAIRLGRELVRSDPLHEDTYRLLMKMHHAAGDRAGAVRVYHECVAALQRELGVEPSAETRNGYAALVRSDQASIHAGPDPVRVSGAVLVGRDDEWDELTRCWIDAEDGRSRLVLVTGEPGVGKTRLVEELGAWCAHRGAVVAHARSYPTEGELGYGILISWLRTAALTAQLRRAGPVDVAELARLLPELGSGVEAMTGPTDEGEHRRRMFDAVARTLTALDRPTLLIADDAQWCDAQSLQLIHYLVRLDPQSPLLVVATVRREELDDGHPLNAVTAGLQIIDRTTEIPLGRLDRANTEQLARDLGGSDFDAESVDDLHAETEGNPLFIVEAIRAGWLPGDGARSALSPKLKAVIGARLGQISEPARELLGVAATVGREFTADLVRGASNVDDMTLVRGLDELWRRGVIREQGTDAYDFSHGKIRDAAYDGLSRATRRRNHLLVAEALQRLHERDLDPVSGQVAANYDRAGRVDDAITWYQRAAVEAQRRHANAEAIRLLERARNLVSVLPGDAHLHQELEVLSALPAALAAVEGFVSDRLAEAQHRALEVAAILGVELEPPLLRSLVMSSLCRNDFDEARASAGQLRASAQRVGDEGLDIESEYLLGITAFWGAAFETARVRFEHVVERFRPEQRGEHLLRFGHDPAIVCLSRLGNTLWFLGELDGARRARDGAVAVAMEAGHPFSRGTALAFATLLSIDLGEDDRVRHYADALCHEEQLSLPNKVLTTSVAGYVDVLDGRVDDGIDRLREAIVLCGPINPAPSARACVMRLLLAAHEKAGDPRGGLAVANEVLSMDGSRIWEPETRRLRAEFLSALGGDRVEVEAELARAADVAHRQGALGLERRVEQTRWGRRQLVD